MLGCKLLTVIITSFCPSLVYMGTLCLREVRPNRNTVYFIPDRPFLRDHIWSRMELLSETLIQDDAHLLQSFPRHKTPQKASNVTWADIVNSNEKRAAEEVVKNHSRTETVKERNIIVTGKKYCQL